MAMRWSRWVSTSPPPAHRAAPAPRRSDRRPRSLMRHAGRRKPGRDGGEPIRFLDPQLVQPAHARRARTRRPPRRPGSDIRRSWRARGSPARRRRAATEARTRRSATSSPPSMRRSSTAMSAPISSSVVSRPVRSGFIITPSSTMSDPSHDQRRHQRKGGRGRVGRHDDRARPQLGPALQHDLAAVRRPNGSTATVGAEMGEHLLGMVARRLALEHGGAARRVQPGQQHGRLDLRRGDRRLVFDRDRLGGALQRDRAASALAPATAPARPSAPADRGCAASGACAGWRRRRRSR